MIAACAWVVVGVAAACSSAGSARRRSASPGATAVRDAQIAQDACQQAYDVYQFMAPQLGLALAGGNATLGQGGVLGGLGHFSVGVRGNVVQRHSSRQVDAVHAASTNGAQRSTLPTKDQVLGLPTADAAIGIFKGFPLALTNVGGVDALVSATYIPTIDDGQRLDHAGQRTGSSATARASACCRSRSSFPACR